ncbi:alpha/beta hydrolase [Jatrophihabitans telluris]|uniref:Alpha/beta hydrolase n=1 Tax=Jatrophihabitans telluris TaxID=2038343 RepID=A0ABY4QVM5_9ACTN|nr:alpha/beta hydrolase [Jatrophihabitans telluris]UQX87096.1 alpha/beta hydrolase [Jatrophihabitans telluris]
MHGAWADGSSWNAVTKKLQRLGYTVDVPPNELRGPVDDSRYLHDYLATVPGPIVLVAHSYGGMLTTNAATGNPNVKALVYIDAYVPAQGDTVIGLTSALPGSALNPATTFNAVNFTDATGKVVGTDLYIKPNLFPAIFATGAPASVTSVLAAGQRPLSAAALTQASPGVPAFKTIPSWDLIGTRDMVIPPAEQQVMATRAGAHILKVNAPHLSMVTDPCAVTGLIVTAAKHS